MADTLDKSKPYGIIIGDSQGRKFEQNGCFFDAHEERIAEEAKEEGGAATAGIGAAVKPQKKDPEATQIEKQLNG